MTDYFVRPQGGTGWTPGAGTTYETAYEGYAGLAAGTALVPGDTIYICGGEHNEEFQTNTYAGSEGSYITFRGDASSLDSSYLDGTFDGQNTVQFAFDNQSGKDYLRIKNFSSIKNFTLGAVRVINTQANGANNFIIENLTINDCAQDVIVINSAASVPNPALVSNIVIRNCKITNCAGAGISISTEIDGVTIENCFVDGWGSNDGLNRWGIYATPMGTDYNTGWIQIGVTNVWYQGSYTPGGDADAIAKNVCIPGASTYSYALTYAGATSALSPGQWGQVGQVIYVNLGGENPNSKQAEIYSTEVKNVIIRNCTVTNWNGTTADGVGIGFDQITEDCEIYNCISYNNGDGFSFNKNISTTARNNIAFNNSDNGFKGYRGSNYKVYNNTSYNNAAEQFDISVFQDTARPSYLYNNIAYGGTHGAVLTTVTSLTNDYNCAYGYSSAVGFTGTNTIASDPLLDSQYNLKASSPCIGAGIAPLDNKDFDGNYRKTLSNDIGAKWFDRHEDSTVNTLLASGGVI